MSNSIDIKKYLPLSTTTEAHPLDKHKEKVENCEGVFGVKWIHKRSAENKNNTDIQAESSASTPNKRIREFDSILYADYIYHRSGEKHIRTDTVKGGISGQPRHLQKKAKNFLKEYNHLIGPPEYLHTSGYQKYQVIDRK